MDISERPNPPTEQKKNGIPLPVVLAIFFVLTAAAAAYFFVPEVRGLLTGESAAPAAAPQVSNAETPAQPDTETAEQASTPAAPNAEENAKRTAASMMCMTNFGHDAKMPGATREAKVKLCDCVIGAAGVVPTSSNYEAEMTLCFDKMLGQPYQETAPDAAGEAAAPPPPAPYAKEIAAIPADQLPALENFCMARAQARAKEAGSDEALFISMNQGYINYCIVSRARSNNLLPPDPETVRKGQEMQQ